MGVVSSIDQENAIIIIVLKHHTFSFKINLAEYLFAKIDKYIDKYINYFYKFLANI